MELPEIQKLTAALTTYKDSLEKLMPDTRAVAVHIFKKLYSENEVEEVLNRWARTPFFPRWIGYALHQKIEVIQILIEYLKFFGAEVPEPPEEIRELLKAKQ